MGIEEKGKYTLQILGSTPAPISPRSIFDSSEDFGMTAVEDKLSKSVIAAGA
jgi:hypothetical protein